MSVNWRIMLDEVVMAGCVIGMGLCVCGLVVVGYLALSNA